MLSNKNKNRIKNAFLWGLLPVAIYFIHDYALVRSYVPQNELYFEPGIFVIGGIIVLFWYQHITHDKLTVSSRGILILLCGLLLLRPLAWLQNQLTLQLANQNMLQQDKQQAELISDSLFIYTHISTIIVAPFFEELFFRGYLYQLFLKISHAPFFRALDSKWVLWGARLCFLVVSSVLFAFAHVTASWQQFLVYLLPGLLFGLLMVFSHTVWVSMAVHFYANYYNTLPRDGAASQTVLYGILAVLIIWIMLGLTKRKIADKYRKN